MNDIPSLISLDIPMGPRRNTIHAFVGTHGVLVVDCGLDGDSSTYIKPWLVEQGIDPLEVKWLVLTHCDVDHYGGMADFRDCFPAVTIVAHEADTEAITDFAAYLATRADEFGPTWQVEEDRDVLDWARSSTRETHVDLRAVGGEVIDLGGVRLELLHVPGHTHGHLAVCEEATRTAIIGDAVLGAFVPNADGTPAFPPTYRYVSTYVETIERFAAMGLKRLGTAHYGSFDHEGALAFLEVSSAFVRRAHVRLLDEISARGDNGATLAELVLAVGPDLGSWPEEVARVTLAFPVVGHLEQLLDRGVIEKTERDGQSRVHMSGASA